MKIRHEVTFSAAESRQDSEYRQPHNADSLSNHSGGTPYPEYRN